MERAWSGRIDCGALLLSGPKTLPDTSDTPSRLARAPHPIHPIRGPEVPGGRGAGLEERNQNEKRQRHNNSILGPRDPVIPSEKLGWAGCQEGSNTEPEEVRGSIGRNSKKILIGVQQFRRWLHPYMSRWGPHKAPLGDCGIYVITLHLIVSMPPK